MKTLITLMTFALTTALFPQNVNGRLSSSVYMFESASNVDSVVSLDNYARAFQMLSLNINESKFSLRTSLNVENEFSADIENDSRVRFYNLYLEGRNLFDVATIKLGRQPLITNVAGGLFDGINLDLKYSDFKLTGYYGGNVPDYQKLEFTEDLENNYVLGGKFKASFLSDLKFSLEYIKKNFKRQEYNAIRLDENLNPMLSLIRINSNQYEFASAELGYEMKNIFEADAKFEYDLNFDEPSKFEFNGSYFQVNDLSLDVYYSYREPRVRYNSIFSVFDYGNTQEIEFGGSYKLCSFLSFSGRYANVSYRDDETSGRITAGLISDYGTVTYRKNLGYAGELDALSVYSAYTLFEGLLTPSVGISLTNYRLSEDSEENSLTTVLAGINYRPWRDLSFDVQGQYMDNKIYQNDYRFFFKVNYWFNTNF